MASISKEFSISAIRSAFDRCVEEARDSVLESSFVLWATKTYRGHEFEIQFGFIAGGAPDKDDFFWHCPNYALEALSLGISEAEEPGYCETYAGDGPFIAREARHELAKMLQSLRRRCLWPQVKALIEQGVLNSQIPNPAALDSPKQAWL